MRLQANAPLIFKPDSNILLFNPIWEQRWVQEAEGSRTYDPSALILWITYTHNLNKRWGVMVAALPRWSGEGSLQFSDGFQMGGAFLVTRKFRPGLKMQLGLYYNKEFFGNFFMPLLGIDWKISPNKNLFGILPSYLVYEHRLSKQFSWGGVFRTFNNSYRIDQRGIPGADDYLRVSDNQLGVYADWYLARRVVMNIEGGHTILRRVSTGLENVRTRKDEAILSNRDNFYFRASLQYRMRFR
jgi:hypothetical protein